MSFFQKIGYGILFWILRRALSLRYTLEVVGLEEILKAKKEGILFLPNHPAEMDPVVLFSILGPHFHPHPLTVEHFFYQRGLRAFMELAGAIPLPTMERPNPWKARQIEKAKEKILKLLDAGENLMIYPAGHLKTTPEEKLRGASLIADLFAQRPHTETVLVRTTGFWGSSFSKALTGVSPDFGRALLSGFKTILKNGIFFAPRRKILVELEFAPKELPRNAEKMELNGWLENWYNKRGPEELSLISYAFWKEDLPEVKPKEVEAQMQAIEVSEDIKAQILAFLSKMTRRPVHEIQPNLHFFNDLGLDSLDASQLYIFLEERFGIEGLVMGQLQTVSDMYQAAAGHRKEVEDAPPMKKRSKWPQESERKAPLIPEGELIQEVFLSTCARMGSATACADAASGALSYTKMKRTALVLSLKIREMPGDKIGVLLPSSAGAYLCILATLLAGKTPVMLNWTSGFRNLEHAADVCGLKAVLSSYRFLSRLETSELGKVDDLLHLLEEVRREISLKAKIKGLWKSLQSPKRILKGSKTKGEDTAVIIFTSGTETLPKGVPLTHRNLLSNLRAAFSCVQFHSEDILYGVLPPFHSFGFSVTGLFPLIAGIKVCYAPDPTDSRALATDIENWKPTLFCCAPSFIMNLLRVAKPGQLNSLRAVVSGAEKAPQELFDIFRGKGITVLEGYGISECSPCVTLGREGEPPKGVGKPLPNVELRIIHPETNVLMEEGKEGEVCIFGPNVFNGYLGISKDPFIEMEGKRWYRSGDRGYLDPDGTLIITGRLKRFVKIGAEMVSLGGLEEDIRAICTERGWLKVKGEGAAIAVTAAGRESEKPYIVLFVVFDVDREELNRALKETGHGRLVKVSEVRQMDEIPMTGAGKTHYRLLDELL